MAAGDHRTGMGLQVFTGKVDHRRRHLADINHITAGTEHTLNKCLSQTVTTQAAIPSQYQTRLRLIQRFTPYRLAELFHHLGVELWADFAAHIVLSENGFIWQSGCCRLLAVCFRSFCQGLLNNGLSL
jgi:hypothetical protein